MRLPVLFSSLCLCALISLQAGDLKLAVEVEEDVYTYTSANNGAGPMWCSGSTSLVRSGGRVYATGLETISGAKPLHNCRWVLFERVDGAWKRRFIDQGRTREPSPMAAFHDGRIFVSGNPTTAEPGAYSGPAKPELWEFRARGAPRREWPRWKGSPPFSEHSYRSLAADGARGELVLFQNIGYRHAEWTFRDSKGEWSAQGRIVWPQGKGYDPPRPVRLCYPNVALADRAVHFFGVGDIVEPVDAWRNHKARVSGRQWDYVFRRLYYTWTPNITREPFRPWIEIATRDATAGHIRANDLRVGSDGAVHLLWTERAIDERLREKFFPEVRQSHALNYAVLKDGKVVLRRALVTSSEEEPGPIVSLARFHVTSGERMLVVLHVGGKVGGQHISENRVAEMNPDGTLGAMQRLPLKHPISNFFTATPRAGSPGSEVIDLFGPRAGKAHTLGYVRVNLR